MRILIAPNAFKGTLSARSVADAIAAGLDEHEVRTLPLADGGDGTLDVIDPPGRVDIDVVDALLRPRTAPIGIDQGVAIIELAGICGIGHLDALQPFEASSLGVGMAARAAIERGAHTIALALGGSASTDAGIGLLIGLGAEVRDVSGAAVTPNLDGLLRAHAWDASAMVGRTCTWRVLADVQVPLLGPTGAAYGFGPQKGLTPSDCDIAEQALERWTQLIGGDPDLPGGGAAGGIAWTAAAVLGADIASGSAAVADMVGLDQALAWADLVITGEGRFDDGSLRGKGCGEVLMRARVTSTPVDVIAGSCALDPMELAKAGVRTVVTLEHVCGSVAQAMSDPVHGVTAAVHRLRLR